MEPQAIPAELPQPSAKWLAMYTWLQWSRRRSLRSYIGVSRVVKLTLPASMEPQAIPAELLNAEVIHLMREQASMEPQAIPAELHILRMVSMSCRIRFNGAAGDPCGVTSTSN